ncbi:MAG: type IV toxin-antitoxin system AbiEi family antitoxin domain-containing protein [Bacteroidota bacterium]
MRKEGRLRRLFMENKGVLTSRELQSAGYNHYSIRKFLQKGAIERVSRGKYVFHEFDENEYFLAQQIIPTGIICLLSAAAIYDYTTFIPKKYHLAIKSNYYPSLPDYPPIKLYYWRKKQYELGVIQQSVSQSTLNIYDKEKTVCDFLKFRNKLDPSIVKEVLKSYIKDEERDFAKLKSYSKDLKIESILSNYLEILL